VLLSGSWESWKSDDNKTDPQSYGKFGKGAVFFHQGMMQQKDARNKNWRKIGRKSNERQQKSKRHQHIELTGLRESPRSRMRKLENKGPPISKRETVDDNPTLGDEKEREINSRRKGRGWKALQITEKKGQKKATPIRQVTAAG